MRNHCEDAGVIICLSRNIPQSTDERAVDFES